MTILARCAFRAGGPYRRGVEIFTLNISTPRRPGCAAILTDTSPVLQWAAVSCSRPCGTDCKGGTSWRAWRSPWPPRRRRDV